jgi:hypothetical protein
MKKKKEQERTAVDNFMQTIWSEFELKSCISNWNKLGT